MNEDNIKNIKRGLEGINWEHLNNKTTEEGFNELHDKITDLINKHAPMKTINPNSKRIKKEPWMTKGLLKSSNTQMKLYKKQLKNAKDDPRHMHYIKYRNLYNTLIRKAKKPFIVNSYTGINPTLNKPGRYLILLAIE